MTGELARLAALVSAYRSSRVGVLRLATPTNLADVRAAVVASDRVDPGVRFTWREVPRDVDGLRRLRGEVTGDTWIDDALRDTIDNDLALVAAVARRDAAAVGKVTAARYGTPSEDDLAAARTVLSSPAFAHTQDSAYARTREVVDGVGMARGLTAVLGRLGLDGWSVDLATDMGARLAVRSSSRVVRVRADLSLTADEATRLVRHEVGVHVLRTANAVAAGCDAMAVGLLGYHATEEGLGVWAEALDWHRSSVRTRTLAMRTLLVAEVPAMTLADAYARAREHLSPAVAFDVAARAKRGTEAHVAGGVWAKDHVYLVGHRRVAALVADRGRGVVGELLRGKFPLERLDEVNGFWADHFLPPARWRLDDVTAAWTEVVDSGDTWPGRRR